MAIMCIRGTRSSKNRPLGEGTSPLQYLRVASHKTNLTVLLVYFFVLYNGGLAFYAALYVTAPSAMPHGIMKKKSVSQMYYKP